MENQNTKYFDDVDIMVDDFVLVEPVTGSEHTVKKHPLIDLVAGSTAGIVRVYASQPFDTVKVKQQTFPKLYRNMWRCFVFIYRNYGIYRGLYAGVIPAVMTGIVENSVLFGFYGGCQAAISEYIGIGDVRNLSALGNACAGSLSAIFSPWIVCPTELVKCKLQAIQEMKRYVAQGSTATVLTPFKLTTRIFQNEGIAGFYSGLLSTFTRDIPGHFIFFGSYEAIREYLTKQGESKDGIGPWKTMLAGSAAGIAQCASTFPADVIKSRIQINNLKSSMIDVAWEILKKDGILAYYNGLLPSILRVIPATGTQILVYEYAKKVIITHM